MSDDRIKKKKKETATQDKWQLSQPSSVYIFALPSFTNSAAKSDRQVKNHMDDNCLWNRN